MDIARKIMILPQRAGHADQVFHRVVRRPGDARGQEKPLDIIPLVEFEGDLDDLLDAEARARRVRGTAIDAIGAVVKAPVGHQHLQQRYAAAVGRIAVTDPGSGRGADAAATAGTSRRARGRTGRIILRGVCEDAKARDDLGIHCICSPYVPIHGKPAFTLHANSRGYRSAESCEPVLPNRPITSIVEATPIWSKFSDNHSSAHLRPRSKSLVR